MVEKIKYDDDCYETTTSKNSVIKSKCIVIAAGNGAFGPNKPPICNIEEYEEKSIFYHIKDKNKLRIISDDLQKERGNKGAAEKLASIIINSIKKL